MSVTKVIFFIVLVKSFGNALSLVALTSSRVENNINNESLSDIAFELLSSLRLSVAAQDDPLSSPPHERSPRLPTTHSNQFSEQVKISNDADLATDINDLIKELLHYETNYNLNVEIIKDGKKLSHDDNLIYKHNNELTNNYDSKAYPVISDDYRLFIENETAFDENMWETRRIFQGLKSRIKDFPFIASISLFGTFHCAGSIIHVDLVLTAASCLQLVYNNRFFRENPKFLTVRVGSSFTIGGGESIGVLEVYFYPSYDPKSLQNNIAIMRLERRIFFKKKSKKVKKIRFDSNAGSLPFRGDITVAGWGARTVSNKLSLPNQNILQYDELHPFHLRDCQDIYSKKYVTKKNFCAGFTSKGGGACNHDVGGPGIYGSKLVGIISFGTPTCGQTDRPTVFTKVGYYAKWIDKIIRQRVPYSYSRTTVRDPYPFNYLTESTTIRTTLGMIMPINAKHGPLKISDIENTESMDILRDLNQDNQANIVNEMFIKEKLPFSSMSFDSSSILDGNDSYDDSQYRYEDDKDAIQHTTVPTKLRTPKKISFTTSVTTTTNKETSKVNTTPKTNKEIRQYTNIIKKYKENVTETKKLTTMTVANMFTQSILYDPAAYDESEKDSSYDTVTIEVEKKILRQGDEIYDEEGMDILDTFETVNQDIKLQI